MPPISDALEFLTAQHEQIEDLYEQVRQIGDEAAFVELADKLSTHLALERELLYPSIAPHFSIEVMTELYAEHASIKEVLAELVWLGPQAGEFRPMLVRLGDLLVGHSAWQEDELFTVAAESMSRDELATLCARFYSFDAVQIAA